MKMDRSLFLLLTGTLAGSGAACVLKVNEEPKNPASAAASSSAAAAPTTAPAPSAAPTDSPKQIGRNLKQVRGIGGLDSPTTAADGGAPAPTPPPAAACLDTGAATAGDCGTMADKSCSWAAKRCNAYKQYLQPKVAAQAVSCTIAAANACTGTTTATCGQTAMTAACTDAKAATVCAQLATACGATADSCTAILSSLNDAGRQAALTYCSAEGGAACKSVGLATCVNNALFPAAEGSTGSGTPKK